MIAAVLVSGLLFTFVLFVAWRTVSAFWRVYKEQALLNAPPPPPLPTPVELEWTEHQLLFESPASWVRQAEQKVVREARDAEYYSKDSRACYPGHPWHARRKELEDQGLRTWLAWMTGEMSTVDILEREYAERERCAREDREYLERLRKR